MNRSYAKPILAGVLLGAALFFLPGFIKFLLLFAVAGLILRFLFMSRMHYACHSWHGEGDGPEGGPGRHHSHHGRHKRHSGFWGFGPWMHPAFTDKIRNMTEEEYQQFREKFQNRWQSHCGNWHEETPPPAQDTQSDAGKDAKNDPSDKSETENESKK